MEKTSRKTKDGKQETSRKSLLRSAALAENTAPGSKQATRTDDAMPQRNVEAKLWNVMQLAKEWRGSGTAK